MRRVAKKERYDYLPVSRRDRLWGLYVPATGHITGRLPGDPDEGHPSPYYYTWVNGRALPDFGISFITQGRGEFESETIGRRTVEAGNVIVTFPDIWHRHRPLPDIGWTNHWVHFGGSYPRNLVRRGVISPETPIFDVGLNNHILRSFLALFQRIDTDEPGLQQLAAANVLEILGSTLARQRARIEDGRPDSLVRLAKSILVEQADAPVDLKELAASLGLSYDYFRHIFKQQTGMAPYQFHLQLRINRARELLCETDMAINEIAIHLQFDTPYHFSRIFKKKTGMTPTEWRNGVARDEDRQTSTGEENSAQSESLPQKTSPDRVGPRSSDDGNGQHTAASRAT